MPIYVSSAEPRLLVLAIVILVDHELPFSQVVPKYHTRFNMNLVFDYVCTLNVLANKNAPSTVKDATKAVSSYTKRSLSSDTTCTCSFKFNDVSTLSKTFTIYEAGKFSFVVNMLI